jgi:hypothetical protein
MGYLRQNASFPVSVQVTSIKRALEPPYSPRKAHATKTKKAVEIQSFLIGH